LLLILLSLFPAAATAQNTSSYLYKATFVQAAPGRLLELIDLLKSRIPAGDEPPFWMRHSQGDHWDLMIIYPMGSYSDYYRPDRIAKRTGANGEDEFRKKYAEYVSWQEDLFVYGPPLADVKKAFTGAGFFHVEIFQSLPGRQSELYKEREMENAYLKKLLHPQNLIFVRDQGAAWDLFTIGFYQDLQDYAASAKNSPEKEEAAATAAGFESAKKIGPYLRTLISQHHDTLAVAIK
jgi:hypothetical protein